MHIISRYIGHRSTSHEISEISTHIVFAELFPPDNYAWIHKCVQCFQVEKEHRHHKFSKFSSLDMISIVLSQPMMSSVFANIMSSHSAWEKSNNADNNLVLSYHL